MKFLYLVLFLLTTTLLGSLRQLPPLEFFPIKSYSSADYANPITETLIYKKSNKKYKIKTKGERWDLRYPIKGKIKREKARKNIEDILIQKGFQIIFKDKERFLVKFKDEKSDIETYVNILYGWRYEFRIYIYKKYFIKANKSFILSFDSGKKTPNELLYHALFDGKHFYTLKVDILEGKGVKLKVKSYIDDVVRIRNSFDFSCDIKYYKSYEIFKFSPYYTDHQIQFSPIDSKGKTKVKVTLIKTPYRIYKKIKDVSKISKLLFGLTPIMTPILDNVEYLTKSIFSVFNPKYVNKIEGLRLSISKQSEKLLPNISPFLNKISRKPGLLKMKNSFTKLPKLTPIGSISGDYDSMQGDYMPNGEAIYWLNNGYYNLEKDGLRTNLVPVLANHITTINWPLYYNEIGEKYDKKDKKEKSSIKKRTKMAIYEVKKLNNDEVDVDISLSHLDKKSKLSKDDFSVYEAGTIKGEVISLEHLKEAMNIVILLDSSGSMKHSMKVALKSVETFIKKLPKDANITLVDFDTKVKPIKASNRIDLLKKLLKIRANGATSLYDATIEGIKLLKDKKRTSIILFTDGKDANYNDTKRGSVADFKQMINIVQKSKIPIYPIAFGNNADTTTLNSIAKITKTTYYQGDNKDSLNKIFDEIRESLSSAYRLRYKRKKASITGSQPVVNFMVDVSGSMDLRHTMYSDCEGCGYRYEQLKEMLSKSIQSLPKNNFIQLSSFASDIRTLQIMTQSKARLLAGIGALKIGGGTEILKAIKKGYDLSKVIPSNRNYFIFVTDAAGDAFKFTEEEKKELNSALLNFKNSGINTFWLGMVDSEKIQKEMGELAKISGGVAFVNSDVNKIRDKILEITKNIKQDKTTKENVGSIMIKLNKRDYDGKMLISVGEKRVDFPMLKDDKPTEDVTDIAYDIKRFKADERSYNYENSQNIYGDDTPIKDVIFKKIIPLTDKNNLVIKGKNRAIDINLKNGYLFSRLKGINAGYRYQYLVMDFKLINHLKSQKVIVLDDGSKHPSSWLNNSNENYTYKDAIPTYKIPNLRNHLFIRVNNSYEVPFNPITWALENPLVYIDQKEVYVTPNETKKGVLAFKIPDKPITSLSLHYYDTAYGHIDLPIIGKMETKKESIETLIKTTPKKLSDAFELSILSKRFKKELSSIKSDKDGVFEIIDCKLDSKVNALLKLNPKKRLFLKIDTPQGDYFVSTHPITQAIPLGFYHDISLAPGSNNRFNLVFHIPEKLKDYPQSLFVELKGDDKEIIINPNKDNESIKPLVEANGDKIKLAINRFYKIKRNNDLRDMIAVDITISDQLDHNSTRVHNLLYLSNTPKPNFRGRYSALGENRATHKGLGGFSNNSKELQNSKKITGIDSKTLSRVLGCENLILDGTKKRCIVLFSYDRIKKDKELYFVSPIFKDLKYKFNFKDLKEITDDDKYLFTQKVDYSESKEISNLAKLLKRVRQKRVNSSKKRYSSNKRVVSLDSSKDLPQKIDPIAISYPGAIKLYGIKSVSKLVSELKKLKWVPSYHRMAIYSTEAIFTQGWTTEYEMVTAFYNFLRTKNIPIETGYYNISSKGKKELEKRADKVEVTLKYLPYIKWGENKENSLVFPFLKPIEELSTELDSLSSGDPLGSKSSELKFKLYYELKKDSANIQMGSMGASLSGSTSGSILKRDIFRDSYKLDKNSNNPIDIWFIQTKDKKGKDILRVYQYGTEGLIYDDVKLPNKIIPKKIEISIYTGDKYLKKYDFLFSKGEELKNIFFTFAFALPDLPEENLKMINKEIEKRVKNVKNISDLSRAQWLNRTKIYKFIALQTKNEKSLQKDLKVNAKRNKSPRMIIATLEKIDNKLISSLDLRNVFNNVYGERKSINSFNIMSGIFNSKAESEVLPNGKGAFEYWNSYKKKNFVFSLPKYKKDLIKILKKSGVSQNIIKLREESKNIWLYPINETKNIAWLEINPNNYHTITVLENGMHGMAETEIMDTLISEGTGYIAGVFEGVTNAVFSVATASLFLTDYCSIIKQAEALSGYASCLVANLNSLKGFDPKRLLNSSADMALSMAGCKWGDEARVAGIGKGVGISLNKGDKKEAISAFLGFANGFGDGVTFYFKNAKKDCK